MKGKKLLFLLFLCFNLFALSSFNFCYSELSKNFKTKELLLGLMLEDRNCIIENYQKIELCLIETFSKEWYDDLCEQDKANNHRFYFHIIANSQGKILSIQKDRLFKGMREFEFDQVAISFKRNYDVCILPPSGRTLQELKEKHRNRLPLTFLYFPNKTRTFLEGWRLNNGER